MYGVKGRSRAAMIANAVHWLGMYKEDCEWISATAGVAKRFDESETNRGMAEEIGELIRDLEKLEEELRENERKNPVTGRRRID